ncbi:hypothetical protein V6N13_146544 [Hibiscus sabdariffa]
MADHLKLQLSLQESSVPDIPKTGIELQQSLQGSRVLDIPKTETKIETLVSMDNFTLATMADDMKLFNNHCRKAVLLTSQKSKLGYVRICFALDNMTCMCLLCLLCLNR